MAQQKNFTQRIAAHRRRANRFTRVSKRRHLRAAKLARLALRAKGNGNHLRAGNLLKRALRVKAGAARAGLRARFNRRRIVQIRRARRLAHGPK